MCSCFWRWRRSSEDRWRAALLLAGAAGAFHVLVGGWTAVAIGLAWLLAGKERPAAAVARCRRPSAGFVLVAAGPDAGDRAELGRAEKTIAREAARIYVFERLSHHLVFHRFPAVGTSCGFSCCWSAGLSLAWLLRDGAGAAAVAAGRRGAVVIGLVGVADRPGAGRCGPICRADTATEYRAARRRRCLRYYWFRMSDSLVPVGVALAIVVGLSQLADCRGRLLASWLLMAAILLAAANLADVCYWRSQQRLPAAILQPRPTADSWPRWWRLARRAEATAEVDRRRSGLATGRPSATGSTRTRRPMRDFLTPREQQTFKWYAGRAEVANWKDVPQDARGLVEWKQALDEIYPRDRAHRRHDLAAFSDDELIALARKYGAQYIVIDRTRAQPADRPAASLSAVREDNPSFEVYRVPELRRRVAMNAWEQFDAAGTGRRVWRPRWPAACPAARRSGRWRTAWPMAGITARCPTTPAGQPCCWRCIARRRAGRFPRFCGRRR